MEKRLVKGEKMICGVCSGIADYLECDVTIVRFIITLLALFYGFGAIPYFILAIIMPEK